MDYIECPHCSHRHNESDFVSEWELYELREDDERQVRCDKCNKEFFVTPNITIEYDVRMCDEDYCDALLRKCDEILGRKKEDR